MFRTTRGKIRGVICAGVLLTGMSVGINAIFSGDTNNALANTPPPQLVTEAAEEYKEHIIMNYTQEEVMVVDKFNTGDQQYLKLFYKDNIYTVEFVFLDTNAIDVGQYITVRYYEAMDLMLEN